MKSFRNNRLRSCVVWAVIAAHLIGIFPTQTVFASNAKPDVERPTIPAGIPIATAEVEDDEQVRFNKDAIVFLQSATATATVEDEPNQRQSDEPSPTITRVAMKEGDTIRGDAIAGALIGDVFVQFKRPNPMGENGPDISIHHGPESLTDPAREDSRVPTPVGQASSSPGTPLFSFGGFVGLAIRSRQPYHDLRVARSPVKPAHRLIETFNSDGERTGEFANVPQKDIARLNGDECDIELLDEDGNVVAEHSIKDPQTASGDAVVRFDRPSYPLGGSGQLIHDVSGFERSLKSMRVGQFAGIEDFTFNLHVSRNLVGPPKTITADVKRSSFTVVGRGQLQAAVVATPKQPQEIPVPPREQDDEHENPIVAGNEHQTDQASPADVDPKTNVAVVVPPGPSLKIARPSAPPYPSRPQFFRPCVESKSTTTCYFPEVDPTREIDLVIVPLLERGKHQVDGAERFLTDLSKKVEKVAGRVSKFSSLAGDLLKAAAKQMEVGGEITQAAARIAKQQNTLWVDVFARIPVIEHRVDCTVEIKCINGRPVRTLSRRVHKPRRTFRIVEVPNHSRAVPKAKTKEAVTETMKRAQQRLEQYRRIFEQHRTNPCLCVKGKLAGNPGGASGSPTKPEPLRPIPDPGPRRVAKTPKTPVKRSCDKERRALREKSAELEEAKRDLADAKSDLDDAHKQVEDAKRQWKQQQEDAATALKEADRRFRGAQNLYENVQANQKNFSAADFQRAKAKYSDRLKQAEDARDAASKHVDDLKRPTEPVRQANRRVTRREQELRRARTNVEYVEAEQNLLEQALQECLSRS